MPPKRQKRPSLPPATAPRQSKRRTERVATETPHAPPSSTPEPVIPEAIISTIVQRVTEQVTTQLRQQQPVAGPSSELSPPCTLSEVPISSVLGDVTTHVTGTNPRDLFQSSTLSIDAKVTNKLKEKIWCNEFIDFGSLLVNPIMANKFHLTIHNVADSQTPALSFEPNAKPKKVSSIEIWQNAFRIFVGVYTQKFPSEAPALMKYSEIIHDLAARGHNWHYYDENFRFLRQNNAITHPWDQLHWELWLRSQVHRTPQPPKQGNSSPFRPYMQIPKGFCYHFHMGRDCTGCRYKHECFKCHKGTHPASSCTFRPYNNNKAQPRAARSSTTVTPNTNKS